MEVEEVSPKLTETFQEGYMQVVDRSPENPKSEIPVILSPGWSENPKVFKDAIQVFLNSGRRVIAFNFPGIRNSTRETSYPNLEVGKAETILELMRTKGIKKADVVCHSEGSIGPIIAASLEPDKFRNLILVGPAGFIGKDSFPKLAGRFSVKTLTDPHRLLGGDKPMRPFFRYLKEGIKFAFRHPIQGLEEAMAISQVQLEDTLQELHNNGVGIAIVSGVNDPVFPMKRLQKIVKRNMIDGFVSVAGGHDEIHLQPKYARAAEQLITNLENKQKNNPTS
ncbi:MAG: hypothetical protein ACD_37C00117G0002 [uncultured bacterium]|uniref:AB hydrolase-1 domain-containing protein n=1 Tax=Candidatus Daviesbacteria bacterium RIFCSPHIGHO2_01_FULL_40_11 TaxID=1797762 RepID=A0A1F5JFA7_9BACT|nr:MAG: hypothetical protein ACD_37C00117G0002 [uncultured bacterium]OGE27337.1 MAG: hypothetical protein A2867_00485 [Candidatus Daviesbacteria bacterium RIFCSPHIGHO2_01_FULL_40_11]OGE62669.1 MAG: hypothetical protein A2964_02775 [Candidatus Daviesbacteria bacterium RIFCSPLOWO2_01_FULL_40_27]